MHLNWGSTERELERDFKSLYRSEMIMTVKLKTYLVVLLLRDGSCLSSATIHFEIMQKGNYCETMVMVHFGLIRSISVHSIYIGPCQCTSVHFNLLRSIFDPFNPHRSISSDLVFLAYLVYFRPCGPYLVHSVHISPIRSTLSILVHFESALANWVSCYK